MVLRADLRGKGGLETLGGKLRVDLRVSVSSSAGMISRLTSKTAVIVVVLVVWGCLSLGGFF